MFQSDDVAAARWATDYGIDTGIRFSTSSFEFFFSSLYNGPEFQFFGRKFIYLLM